MARMTKKQREEAERAAAAREWRIFNALRWSGPAPEPDVPPPDGWGELTTGYTFYARRVDVACSSSGSHAVGRTDKTTSQRPLALYSTRALALRALRAKMEREFAEELAKIDEMLAVEEAQHNG